MKETLAWLKEACWLAHSNSQGPTWGARVTAGHRPDSLSYYFCCIILTIEWIGSVARVKEVKALQCEREGVRSLPLAFSIFSKAFLQDSVPHKTKLPPSTQDLVVPSINAPDPRLSLEGPPCAWVKHAHKIGRSQQGLDLLGSELQTTPPFAKHQAHFSFFSILFILFYLICLIFF